jgi:hypothetical protein
MTVGTYFKGLSAELFLCLAVSVARLGEIEKILCSPLKVLNLDIF